MNKLLQRQIQKHLVTGEMNEDLVELLNVISESYDHYEKDRKLIERSIELSSKEMIELNSELKKEKEELKKAHSELKLLFENINEVLFSVDMVSGKLIQMSAGCEKVYGYTSEDFFTNGELWRQVVYFEDYHIIKQQLKTLCLGCQVVNQYRIIHKDRSIRWLENKVIPTLDETGRLVRIDGITSDISERKLAAIELQKRAKELAVSNEELEQFAYVASHDLQEPLRMVTGFLTQLDKKYSSVIDDKGRKYIHFAVDGAKRMRQIILDLLDYSRAGRIIDNIENVDLNELVDEIETLYRKEIEEKKAVIIFDRLPQIRGHRSPLRQVFQNLIGNALKYSRNDTPPKIVITADVFADHWQFTVSDNGIGISQEYFDKVFVIFQRLHNMEEYSGTGIGLAITKKIIENFGGKIWLSSEEGRGSDFYFTISKK